MCGCKNIEVGSYLNQIAMKNWWNNTDVCVDECLSQEIYSLWDNKIKTTGCCCGHNKLKPMINVADRYHENMIALNYEYWINNHNVKCYKPKTIK